MNLRLHCLQHGECEAPGTVRRWAEHAGHVFTTTRLDRGELLPADGFDGLIVMGGMMGAYEVEKYPWLAEEKKFIARVIAENRPMLGICLGAQLIAEVLGAKVGRHCHREIGWFPVEFTAKAMRLGCLKGVAPRLDAFHWHGDSFTLPPNAQQLARSEACEQQGFLYGDKIMGLQFHPEVSMEEIAAFVKEGASELEGPPEKYVQSAAMMRDQEAKAEPMRLFLTGLLDRFFIR